MAIENRDPVPQADRPDNFILPARQGARLVGNSAWNVASFAVGLALNLFTLPVVVAHVGVAGFGLAGLVTACVAPATIFSVTLSQLTVHALAQHLDPVRRGEAKAVLATTLMLALAIGVPVVLLLAAGGPWFAPLAFDLVGETSTTRCGRLSVGRQSGGCAKPWVGFSWRRS